MPLDYNWTPCSGVWFTVFSQSAVSFIYGVRVRVQVRAVFLATGDPKKAMGLEVGSILVLYPIKQFIILVMSLGYNTQLQNGGNPMLGQGQGQGIGQDRSLCNGRTYKGYGVMVCFIYLHLWGHGQGLGQFRVLCDGRSYWGYGVRVHPVFY